MNRTTNKHWSRRSALQQLALGAGGLSFAASAKRDLTLFGGPAAAAMAQPKRLIVLVSLFGIREGGNWSDWLVPGATETDFALAGQTLPLGKHKANAVFFDNLVFGTTVNWGDTHLAGNIPALTASRLVKSNGQPYAQGEEALVGKCKAGGPSIDAYLGHKIGRTVTPQWPSLQMNFQQGGGSFVSYGMDGTMLPAASNPWDVYGKMFAQIPDGGTVTPDPALAKRVLRRKSVLDAVAKDVGEFKRRLPPEDRARADAQLDAVRTLETRFASGGQAPGAGCKKPALGAPMDARDTKRWPEIRRATSDLVVASMACDLTRFAMINWRGGYDRPLCNFAPLNSSHYEHEMSHDFRDEFLKMKQWYMAEAAYLADRLEAIPEAGPDGRMGSMLDNTIILWATEISMGHQHGRMPFFTLGGKNLGVRGGRCLKLPTIWQNNLLYRKERGYPHARLFVSLLQAMGLPESTFGDPDVGKGPMDGYLGA